MAEVKRRASDVVSSSGGRPRAAAAVGGVLLIAGSLLVWAPVARSSLVEVVLSVRGAERGGPHAGASSSADTRRSPADLSEAAAAALDRRPAHVARDRAREAHRGTIVRPSLTTLLHDKRAVAPRRVRPAATRAAAPQLAANDGACWRMPAALHSYPFNENLASIVWSRPVQTAHGPLDDVSAAVRSRDWPKEKRARLFALLPTYAQVRHVRYRSCAVVGSSPEVLLYEDGAEIDRHDAVFRANLAVTRGYEKHVGNRTTVRVINPVASIGEARTPRLGGAAQGGDATIIIKSQDPPAVRDPSSEHEKFLIEQTRRRGPPTADFLARRQVLELCNFLFLQSGVALADPPLAALAVNLSRVERQFDESARTNMARAWHPLGSGIPRFSVAHCSTGTMLLTEALLLCDRVRLFGFHVCDCTRACARGGVSVRNHYWDTKPTAEFGRMAVRYNSHMRYYHRLRDACDVDFDIARLAHCDAPPPPRRGKGVAQPPPV